MSQQEILRGTVAAILFQNEATGYTVLRMTTEAGDSVNVVGTIPLCSQGERMVITGHWETHSTHGEQFRAEALERLMPDGIQEIEHYLASRAIRGIGPKSAARIVARFGNDTFRIMEECPEELAMIPGISLKKAMEIGEGFQKQFGMRKLLEFLLSHSLPADLAMPLYRAYGDLAQEALRDDPYLLTDSFFGADFAVVDAFAVSLGIDAEDSRRLESATLYTLRHNLGNGHTFLPSEKLCNATATMLSVRSEAIEDAMDTLHETGRIVLDSLRDTSICYLPEYHAAEVYVAQWMSTRALEELSPPGNLKGMVREIQRSSGITYAENQRQAIEAAATHSVMLLTGGPGTGKTTTVNGILALLNQMHIKTELAAPTGRAAERLGELCGREASTIHRLLECQFDTESGQLCFTHDESDPLKAGAVIVDETSMVDILLMEALLRALKPDCRLILVGDPDQLPSVGAGMLFSDLIRSQQVPAVCLNEIFRQARESLIVMNAHSINRGELPELGRKDKDFFLLVRRDNASIVDTIADLCVRRLPQNMHIPADQIQVLSPTRKTDAGTAVLNARLQAVLNPPSPEKQERKYGKIVFREGDRVMQIRNDYDIIWRRPDGHGIGTGVFNGDVGRITEIDTAEETLTVAFDDKIVDYSFDLLGKLVLAYAMTVHKSHGSEYRAVILSVSHANPYLLTRSILYTAVTRARELLILVGDPNVVAQMVNTNRQSRRYSGLKLRLCQGL